MVTYNCHSGMLRSKEERAKWREMRQRPVLRDDEFFERFFGDTGIAREIPIQLRRIYATHLGMSRVWPADKATEFDSELDLVELPAHHGPLQRVGGCSWEGASRFVRT